MRRIIADDVRRAFHATGLKPSRLFWMSEFGEAMAIAAIVEKITGNAAKLAEKDGHYIGSILQCGGFYIDGFCLGWIEGWAGNPIDPRLESTATPTAHQSKLLGWWDGARAAASMRLPTLEEEQRAANARYFEWCKHNWPRPRGEYADRKRAA